MDHQKMIHPAILLLLPVFVAAGASAEPLPSTEGPDKLNRYVAMQDRRDILYINI
jgi:hypothetical protein